MMHAAYLRDSNERQVVERVAVLGEDDQLAKRAVALLDLWGSLQQT
jgi:hypothetical protein